MEVILREDVQALGRSGDIVNVKNGYARNFLIPQNLAVAATRRSIKQLDHQKRELGKHAERQRKEAASLAERINGLSVTVAKPAGDNDRLFGSVTAKDVAQGLADEGISGVSRKQLQLTENIRHLGIFQVPVRLSAENTVELKVWVVAKE